MEILRSVIGGSETVSQVSSAETIERLVDRVNTSTLIDDRRDACRALRAMSKKFRQVAELFRLDSKLNVKLFTGLKLGHRVFQVWQMSSGLMQVTRKLLVMFLIQFATFAVQKNLMKRSLVKIGMTLLVLVTDSVKFS